MKSFLLGRVRSFVPAIQGGLFLLRTQPNARVHAAITCGVMVAGLATGLSRMEWLALSLTTAAVWTAEAFNTAIEQLADEVTMEQRERIGRAKDLAAFAVLITAVAAVAVGLLVFLPHWLGSCP